MVSLLDSNTVTLMNLVVDVEDCFLNFSEEDLKRIDDAISTQLEQVIYTTIAYI